MSRTRTFDITDAERIVNRTIHRAYAENVAAARALLLRVAGDLEVITEHLGKLPTHPIVTDLAEMRKAARRAVAFTDEIRKRIP